jgi:hypothetical protein
MATKRTPKISRWKSTHRTARVLLEEDVGDGAEDGAVQRAHAADEGDEQRVESGGMDRHVTSHSRSFADSVRATRKLPIINWWATYWSPTVFG